MTEMVQAVIERKHTRTVFHALGISIDKIDADETIVSLTIDDRHRQHMGLVHGGLYALLAESAASLAAACTLTSDQTSVVALEINANHLHGAREGKLSAASHCLHRGKRTLVYEVKVSDDEQRLISVARCTLMVVPLH